MVYPYEFFTTFILFENLRTAGQNCVAVGMGLLVKS